jgi:hypothetical protein
VPDQWTPFVLQGGPVMNMVTNENAIGDVNGQYALNIESDEHPFDAGIFQVIHNVTPGVFYTARVGFALAATDLGDGKNVRVGDIGRTVGIDPLGNADPRAPDITWTNEFHDLGPALNIPALVLTVAARADHITLFVRAIDHNTTGRSKVWFDVICLEPDFSRPTEIPPSPTITLTPTREPTDTRVPKTNTPLPTDTPANTATPTPTNTPANTPTTTATPTFSPTPRKAIPIPTPATSQPTDSTILGALGPFGVIALIGGGILLVAALVFWLWSRASHPRGAEDVIEESFSPEAAPDWDVVSDVEPDEEKPVF